MQLRHANSCLIVRATGFAIGLEDSDHHLPDGQVKFFGVLKLQNYCRAYFF